MPTGSGLLQERTGYKPNRTGPVHLTGEHLDLTEGGAESMLWYTPRKHPGSHMLKTFHMNPRNIRDSG